MNIRTKRETNKRDHPRNVTILREKENVLKTHV